MRHLVLTRYNLPITFANSDTRDVRQTDGWLEKRKYLFDRYCLPSIRAQTSREFDWYVGFSPSTPAEYTNYFGDVGTPIRATSIESFQRQIQEKYRQDKDYTILSRLDNDDAFGNSYVEATQNLAKAIIDSRQAMGIPHVINFRHGWEIDDSTSEVYKRDYPNSSFFSILSGPHGREDIFENGGRHHAHVHKHFPVSNISLKTPMWMITVHGDNIGNVIKGRRIDATIDDRRSYFGEAPWTDPMRVPD